MVGFLLNSHVDSSGIFPNFPSLIFLASEATLTYSGPTSLAASWLAFRDQLQHLISTVLWYHIWGHLRSSNQVVQTQFRIYDLLQLLQHFIVTNFLPVGSSS